MSNNRHSYQATLIRETKKAFLLKVTEGDRQAELWLPKKWCQDQGDDTWMLTHSKVEEALESAERDRRLAEKLGDYRLLSQAVLVRETEKALQVEIEMNHCDGEPRSRKLWFPKSHARVSEHGILVREWLIRSKEEELVSIIGSRPTISIAWSKMDRIVENS